MYTLSGARLNITSQPTPSPVLLTTQFVSLAFYVSCGRKFSILKNSSLYFFHSAPLFFSPRQNIKMCCQHRRRRRQPRRGKSNIIQYVDFLIVISLQIPSLFSVTISFLFFHCVSADHGKVLKTINAASADDSSKVSSVVIEELDVLAKPEPIRNLKIVRTMQYGEFDVSLFCKGCAKLLSSPTS